MSMYGDDNSVDTFEDGDGNPPEESNNRTFLFIAGGLGILVLIGLCAVVGYFFISRGSTQQAESTAQAQNLIQETAISVGLTQNAKSQAETQAAGATSTVPPTTTPVIAQASATASPTQNPATATVGAAFTQIAAASTQTTLTVIATSTALPNTGFADDVGLPGMFAMAFAFVIVIFLVRKLRAVPAR